MKIRIKIILGFSALFIFLITAFFLISTGYAKEVIIDLVHRRIEVSSRLKTSEIELYFKTKEREINQILAGDGVKDAIINSADEEVVIQARRGLKNRIETIDDVVEMVLTDRNGRIVVATDETDEGKLLADLTKIKVETDEKKIKIGQVFYDDLEKKYIFWIVTEVASIDKAKIIGWYGQKVVMGELSKIVSDILGDYESFDAFLVNQDKYLLTGTNYLGEENILNKKIETGNVSDCFDQTEVDYVTRYGHSVSGEEHHDHTQFKNFLDYRRVAAIGTHSYIPEIKACLITKVDESEAMKPYQQFVFGIGILFLISLVVFTVFGFLISSQIVRTLNMLVEKIKGIQNGDYDSSVRLESGDEIEGVSVAIDEMRESIKNSRFEIERQVENQTKEIVEKSKAIEDQQKALVNVLEDVTEEKEKVELEKDKNETILYSIGDGVLVVDKERRIVLVNQVAVKVAGYNEQKEVLGKKYTEVFRFVDEQDESKVRGEFIDNAIKLGKVQEMANHTVLINKEGKRIPVSDSAAPLKGKDEQIIGCVVVFRDVSRERELEKIKDDFVAMTSHELRTPLGAIKGFASMMLEGDYGKLAKECEQPVADILASSERMIRLVNDLLNLSRIESGRLKYELSQFGLTKVIKETTDQMRPLVLERGLSLQTGQISEVNVQADIDKVRQILINLIGNAIKFTKKGSIKITASEDKEEVRVLVSDTGIGIAKEDQIKLFKKFERVGKGVEAKFVGTGLGLYVSREIVRKMGGNMWLEKSVLDKGSIFAFSLPKAGGVKANTIKEEIMNEAKKQINAKELV